MIKYKRELSHAFESRLTICSVQLLKQRRNVALQLTRGFSMCERLGHVSE